MPLVGRQPHGPLVKQVVHDLGGGGLRVLDVPRPSVRPHHVLIANRVSVISSGTERASRALASKGLLHMARERPEQARRVLEKVRHEGFASTVRQVQSRLKKAAPLGYSSAGTVLALGEGVEGVRPGDLVASNGPHAEVVCVSKHLCAVVPACVAPEQAAFGILGSIALHSVRLARIELGCTVVVLGLGLIGQLCVALLRNAGCCVLAADPHAARCRLAESMGADQTWVAPNAAELRAETRGHGADAVLVCAASDSSEPARLALEAVRRKGRVVVVGAVGLDLPRPLLFDSEAELVVARSYGPGRYDPHYEEDGRDYPFPYVRWTEQRNLGAVLDLMASGALDPRPLISHRFDLEEAPRAYGLLGDAPETSLAVLLQMAPLAEGSERKGSSESNEREKQEAGPASASEVPSVAQSKTLTSSPRIGVLGAGQHARNVLLPLLRRIPDFGLQTLCSAGGLHAGDLAVRHGFRSAESDEQSVLEAEDIDTVFVLTRHDQHARQVCAALDHGKHVFVEKPLALRAEEIEEIQERVRGEASHLHLMVGFNRRFAPAVRLVRDFFDGVQAPLAITYRCNAGTLDSESWTQREQGGGRLLGEACHGLDLASFLARSLPVRVFAETGGGPAATEITTDQCIATVRYASGSIASIAYLAHGDRAVSKERVEVIGGGRIAVIDDFRRVTLIRGGRRRVRRFRSDSKGHRAMLEQFAHSLLSGDPVMSWAEIEATARTTILLAQSIRLGGPLDVDDGQGT